MQTKHLGSRKSIEYFEKYEHSIIIKCKKKTLSITNSFKQIVVYFAYGNY